LSRIRPSQNEFHNKDALGHQAPKTHGIQDQFLQHLSQKKSEAILVYYSITKGVSVYLLSFNIRVDNGQLLAISVHSEQNRGKVDDLVVNPENMICRPILLLRWIYPLKWKAMPACCFPCSLLEGLNISV
jgi:hypothetical protein